MKNLITIIAVMFTLSALGQQVQLTMYKGSGATYSTILSQTTDTITANETTYFYTRAGALNKYTSGAFVVKFIANTTSGTINLNAVQEGSFDGVTWFRLNGDGHGTDGRNCDTLAISSNPTSATFFLSTIPKSSKLVGVLRGSVAIAVPYFRLRLVSGATANNTIVSSFRYCPFQL